MKILWTAKIYENCILQKVQDITLSLPMCVCTSVTWHSCICSTTRKRIKRNIVQIVQQLLNLFTTSLFFLTSFFNIYLVISEAFNSISWFYACTTIIKCFIFNYCVQLWFEACISGGEIVPFHHWPLVEMPVLLACCAICQIHDVRDLFKLFALFLLQLPMHIPRFNVPLDKRWLYKYKTVTKNMQYICHRFYHFLIVQLLISVSGSWFQLSISASCVFPIAHYNHKRISWCRCVYAMLVIQMFPYHFLKL